MSLPNKSLFSSKYQKTEWIFCVVLGLLVIALWMPRLHGPIDLRWDGGVYYLLGTSLAEGKGYRLLNEPGEIEAIQYPPLLPLIVAAHQKLLGTSDILVVGQWLRLFSFAIFFLYIVVIFLALKHFLPLKIAFLGTLICLFHMNAYFMSDLLFPEVLFGLATILFVLFSMQGPKGGKAVAAALLGVAAFGLRTIGLALLVAWIAEGLLNKNIKLVTIRFIVALVPLLCWQGYILSVIQGEEYRHPAYDYQRAAYMFYNVSYAKNIFTFKDPFIPEMGSISMPDIGTRFLSNLKQIPLSLGEAVSSPRLVYEAAWRFFDFPFPISTPWPVDVLLFALGSIVLAGIVLQLIAGQWLLPFYVLLSIAGICLTPWPQQFTRYFMPLMPFLVLFLLTALLAVPRVFKKSDKLKAMGQNFIWLVVFLILIQHALTVTGVYLLRHQTVTYRDRSGEMIQYRLFFYRDANRALDRGLDWLMRHAKPTDILAGSMPHWMYLRTGLKSVMPPFERDPVKAQDMMDSVPVTYLLQDEGLAIETKQYIEDMVEQFPNRWERVYIDRIVQEDKREPPGMFAIYRRK